MKPIAWDEYDEHTFLKKCEKGIRRLDIGSIAAGMTATASVSGRMVEVKIISEPSSCTYEGTVIRIDSNNTIKIDLKVGDTVVLSRKNLFRVNQDIK